MPNFEEDYNIIIDALIEAKDKISTVDNSNVQALKNSILHNLQRDIGGLRARIGKVVEPVAGDEGNVLGKRIAQPLMSFLGYKLPAPEDRKKKEVEKKPITMQEFNKKVQETTEDQQGKELAKNVEQIYPDFNGMTNDQIRDRLSNYEVLGVARKVGFPVTEKTEVNDDLINKIKAAIKKKEQEDKRKSDEQAKLDKNVAKSKEENKENGKDADKGK